MFSCHSSDKGRILRPCFVEDYTHHATGSRDTGTLLVLLTMGLDESLFSYIVFFVHNESAMISSSQHLTVGCRSFATSNPRAFTHRPSESVIRGHNHRVHGFSRLSCMAPRVSQSVMSIFQPLHDLTMICECQFAPV